MSHARAGSQRLGVSRVVLRLLAAVAPVEAQFTNPDHVVVARSPGPSAPLVVATNPDPSTRTRITITCRSHGVGPTAHPPTEIWVRHADGSGRSLLGTCPRDNPERYFIAMANVAELLIVNPGAGEDPVVTEYELGCVAGRSLPRPTAGRSAADWWSLCDRGLHRRGDLPTPSSRE